LQTQKEITMKASLFASGKATTGFRGALLVGLAVSALVLGLASPGSGQGKGNPNPGVVPPNSKAYGKTYGEWAAAWWNWALSSPLESNPVVDETGEFCDVNQAGPVWFLAGTFGGSAERECTVPAGKPLFFPIINTIFAATEPEETEEELRAGANADIDDVTVLEVSVDGVPLQDLSRRYRAESPAFVLHLPEGAILDQLSGLSGDLFPAVADGYWILLAPLSVGEHVIHFRGAKGDPEAPDFETEVTYYLTVAGKTP
jgi:hypothetical protein